MDYCKLEVAFGDRKQAEEVSQVLLDKKLISACQIIEADSAWNWKGQRESSKEYITFLITRKDKIDEIYKEIRKIHTYECFEFCGYELTSLNLDYLKWIDDEVE
jgi:uncharacterized protein involved in tolerance to divalent cations